MKLETILKAVDLMDKEPPPEAELGMVRKEILEAFNADA